MYQKVYKDAATISKGYLSDNAIKYSLKEKAKVHIINSVEAKCLNSKGVLAAKIEFHRRQTHIEDIFVILYFDSPQHFACLYVKESILRLLRDQLLYQMNQMDTVIHNSFY